LAILRIIVLANAMLSEVPSGGPIRFVEIMKRASRHSDLELMIITSKIGEKFCKDRGLNANFLITTREKRIGNVIFLYMKRMFSLNLTHLKVANDTIFYSTSDFLPDVLPVLLYKRRARNTKWIQVIHHVIPSKREGSVVTNLISHYAQKASFFLIKRYSDLIITVSPIVKDNLKELGFLGRRIKVNSNGVDITHFRNIPSADRIFYDAIFMGRLHPSKGIFDLVKIWAIVCKAKPLRLGIIGGGDPGIEEALRIEIENQGLSDNIDILGYLDADKAFGIMKSSKVFVFPSHEEGFGIAILEAMACGLPVVSWDLPVYKSVFSNAILTIDRGNIKKMAISILKLIDDSELRNELIELGNKQASQYNWDEIAGRELSLVKMFAI